MDRYGWGPRDVGFSLDVVGVCMLVVQGFLIRKIIPLWGSRRAAYVGLMLATVAFFGYALSPVGWAMYIGIVIGAGVLAAGSALTMVIALSRISYRE